MTTLKSLALLSLGLGVACGPPAAPPETVKAARGAMLLPDVRVAPGRPPVVLVSRDGDPAAAIAVAVTTSGLSPETDDPEAATALAGLIDARLRAAKVEANVTPAWDGLRASTLATSEAEAARIAEVMRDAFGAPATDADLAPVRKKLAALGQRPLRDKALGRWARCVGQPHSTTERAGKDYADIDVAKIERWRAAALGLGRVAVAITGPAAYGEAVAKAVLQGPIWKNGAALTPSVESSDPVIDVFEAAPDTLAGATTTVHVTLDVGSSSAAVMTAEALGDPRGPLAARLSDLDLPFRIREVTGAAHARGGCVGVILEAASGTNNNAPAGGDLMSRIADGVALVHLEASVHIAGMGTERDGRVLSRQSGDAREASERAAWWALVDQTPPKAGGGSVALGLGSRRASPKEATTSIESSREALTAAVLRARAAWDKPVVEARTRVEAGQGEAWVLLGSPCGTDGETDTDAGLTALFTTAAVDSAKASNDVRVEPWVVIDGAGILVHGPALNGETPAAHARRLADIAARSYAAEPIGSSAIAKARADLLRHDARNDGSAMSILAQALAPQHPSWVIAWGASEPLARSSDSSVLLRAQSLRAGPVRVAVLANADASQADAAVRAADRWVTRRTTGEARQCRAPTGAQPPKPGTYAIPAKSGAVPEAYLAFPFGAGDEAAHAAALLFAAALDGGEGLLDKALSGIARESSARVLGWPRAPALVLRVVAAQASLDNAVMQARGLVDRLHKGGLPAADFDHAVAARTKAVLATSLDPRARVVATWRNEPIDAKPARLTSEDARAFAQKVLAEDTMVIVASRPQRTTSVGQP